LLLLISISISVIYIVPPCGSNGYFHVQLVIGIFHLGVLFWMSKYHIATGFCLLDRMVLSQPVLPWEKPDAFFFSE
jgi:hypothetical protein